MKNKTKRKQNQQLTLTLLLVWGRPVIYEFVVPNDAVGAVVPNDAVLN